MITRRICLFVGALNAGGAERVLVWLARQLAASGTDVTIVTLESCENDVMIPDAAIRRHALELFRPNPLWMKPVANIQRILALRQVLRHYNVDTVLAFMPHESVLAILASLGINCRVIISERIAPWRRSPGRIWSVLRWLLYRFSDAQVAQTQAIASWLRSVTRCRSVRVIPNAVQFPLPANPPNVCPSTVCHEGRKILLAVGTKPYQKGFDILLEAFALVAAEHPDWDLVILGLLPNRVEGNLCARAVMQRAEKNDIDGRVFFPGRVGNLSDWYSAADLFVLSSRFEGFPNVLLEAMSHGCASVAIDCETGPDEIIEDGINGLLVREQSASVLATSLSRCMSDGALRRKLSTAAIGVRKKFGSSEVFELWSHVLSNPSV